MKTAFSTPNETDTKFVRRFAGNRDLLWAVWTQAAHLRNWWGPAGWTVPVCTVDFRVGGEWFYCMEGPDGMQSCGISTYREIVTPRRFACVDRFADAQGVPVEGMPEGHTTFEFSEMDGETILTNVSRYASQELRDQVIEMGVEAGVSEMFDCLDEYLASLA